LAVFVVEKKEGPPCLKLGGNVLPSGQWGGTRTRAFRGGGGRGIEGKVTIPFEEGCFANTSG